MLTTLDAQLAKLPDPAAWNRSAELNIAMLIWHLQDGQMDATQTARVLAHLDVIAKARPDAAAFLADQRHVLTSLMVGDRAPEITGRDMDGVPFKLSDYRGKVVVLTFSGDWCAACRGEYPYQKQLMAEYRSQSVVLLGVNSDADLAQARQAKLEHGVEYRTWWDGGGAKSTAGPIAKAWGIVGWPTVYVIDPDGVIRAINLRRDDLVDGVRQIAADASLR